MESQGIAQEIASLPPEAQKQVSDFVACLKRRYAAGGAGRRARRPPLADEPFIGMWRDREDMQDSTRWVRELRREEWERNS